MAQAPDGDETLTPDDAAKILEELLEAQNHTKLLGLMLNLKPRDVEAILIKYKDPKEQLLHIILAFLQQAELRPTWRAIVEALRSSVVGLTALANKIETNHFPNLTASREADTATTSADKRAQEIIDKAMESGSVQQRNVVGVITGLMGSGKTTLLSHLFGEAPPGLYTSTGVTEQSFRGLLHNTILRITVSEWQRLSGEDIRKLLVKLFKAGMKMADIDILSASIIEQIDPDYKVFTSQHSAVPAMVGESPSCQEMVPMVRSEYVSEVPESLLLELVHMIDTGGQPELMEVMPSLVHNANLAMVLVDLRYGLDARPDITYHCEGVRYDRELSSHYTGKEIVLKLASSLQAKRSLCGKFNLLIVATHRDCVKEDLDSRVKTLNQELRDILLPAFEEQLILAEAPDKIAFVLNLANPESSDLDALEIIRKKVGQPGLGNTFDTPSSFFVLEQDLLHFAANKVKRDILSVQECEMVGARLKMSGEVVHAALVLFHRQNTFLYFRHILPNHIFIKPQVPLDIIYCIVRSKYKRLQGIPAKLAAYLQRAVVTEELLGNKMIVSSHFVSDFYQPQHAITLFCHTFTLAPLHPSEAVSRENREYLMMCMVPGIPADQLHLHIPQSSDTVPLVLKFGNGCVPLGCFSSTISCLISHYGWEVYKQGTSPKCLAHNIVSLRNSKLVLKIVIVVYTKYLEVHIDSDLSKRVLPASLCHRVHTQLFEAIQKVFAIMRLDTDKIRIVCGVFCSCPNLPERHFSEFVDCENEHLLSCESKPNSKQLLWMGRYSRDVAMTAEGEEPTELTSLNDNMQAIKSTVRGNLEWFSDCLVKKKYITREKASSILGITGVFQDTQTRQFMDDVYRVIKSAENRRDSFDNFVDIFSHNALYNELVESLKDYGSDKQ